jgi:D-sedoheptulose 7-phosphate isomerase
VITLGTNTAVSTAWSNDHNFDDQFAREVEAYGMNGSTFFGITTSGNSENLKRAFMAARALGMKTVALASDKAIPILSEFCDVIIAVPGKETHKIQESHIVVYHALCVYIEAMLPDNFL